jgi:peptidoglycan-associated lipoprotein
MRFKLLTIIAAVMFLGACSSLPEEAATTTGGGATSVNAISGPVPGSQEDLIQQVGDRIFFDYDKSDIRSDQRSTVDALAAWLKHYPSVRLHIEGHADERGTREYNLALGDRRANSVREFLIALGIDSSRLRSVSYGEERPSQLGSNESAWAKNRRAVFIVK